jgi:hypothetical protein
MRNEDRICRVGIPCAGLTIIVFFATGCATGDEGVITSRQYQSSQTGDPSSILDNERTADDSPSLALSAVWSIISDTVSNNHSELTFTITNRAGHSYLIEIEILCSGLIRHEASLSIGQHEVEHGGSVTLSVLASSLPIQTRLGFAQATISVAFLQEAEASADSKLVLSRPIFYQHSSNYSTVMIASHAGVIDGYYGELVPSVNTDYFDASEVIGKLATGDGSFREVRRGDLEYATATKHLGLDKVVGYETGLTVGVAMESIH